MHHYDLVVIDAGVIGLKLGQVSSRPSAIVAIVEYIDELGRAIHT